MATTEHNALIRARDASGNSLIIYPITKIGNVDGLDEAIAVKAEVNHQHAISDVTELQSSIDTINENVAAKSAVQIITWGDSD